MNQLIMRLDLWILTSSFQLLRSNFDNFTYAFTMAKSYRNVFNIHLVDFRYLPSILLAQEMSIEDVLKIQKCPEYFEGCCPHRFCHPRAGPEKNGIIINFD